MDSVGRDGSAVMGLGTAHQAPISPRFSALWPVYRDFERRARHRPASPIQEEHSIGDFVSEMTDFSPTFDTNPAVFTLRPRPLEEKFEVDFLTL